MLYRHFPKIANRTFSIIALDPWGQAPDAAKVAAASGNDAEARATGFLRLAAENGANLVWAGFGSERAERSVRLLESAGLRKGLSLILGLDRSMSDADLGAFMDRSGAGTDDILLVEVPDAGHASRLRTGDLIGALAALRREGKICGFGFSAPAEATVIETALDASDEWDCWSMPYNYLKGELAEAILQAGRAGLGLLALDPFAGGILEGVPAEVHELFRDAPVPRSHDEWALRAIWDSQEVTSVVLNPANGKSLTKAAILAEAGRPNSLLSRELDILKKASAIMNT